MDAFEAGIKALARKELSRNELATRLKRAGFERDDALLAVDELAEAGYQSDERAATERARAMAARRYGDIAVRADLRRRGIADDTIEVALAGIVPEAERAEALSRRTDSVSRFVQALRRKGYTEGTIEGIAELGPTGVG
jgi:regulatory protein